MPELDQPEDVLVDVTPVAPPPRSRRRLWLTVTAVAVLGAAAFGVAFADNFADLGAYRYDPPKTFDGLPLVPEASKAKQSRVGSESGVSATTYLAGDQQRMVFLTVSERHIFLPSSELDDLLSRQRSNGEEIADLHEVDPGDRGGVMKCGRADAEGHAIAVCDWADGSMWGMYSETAEDVDAVAAHARDFRRQAEVPS
ncbi:hypothetical protein [Streptomyces rubellomurinus]|uniref:hypothetical protein n=1 Tax=Streptomyces rubellomurinus (strain ATCC 31215) TaxID=359131 RepID=UPI0012FE9D21|nr:hypothetical protein [Streptomyces rubellomurinus]